MTQLTGTKHLLLMDDDEDDFLFLKEVVGNYFPSIIVSHFTNCEEVSKADFDDVDFVLLDINMPRINGFGCLDLIRVEFGLTCLPVIMYSNSFAPGDVALAYEKGANLFVNKPASINHIKKVVTEILSSDWQNIEEITSENRISNKILKY